jgi:DNA primase
MNVGDELQLIANNYLQKVKPSGPENIMAICPFHTKSDGTPERHPSFAMSLTNGLWFCHSCQAKGNLYTFFRDLGFDRHNIDFHFGMLLEEAKKNMPQEFDPANPGVFSSDPIPESLLGLFDYCPTNLLQAGFDEGTLRRFEIGFDMHHYRVTYPVRDLVGNLMAISGRTVNDAYPKYKVYTEEFKAWGLPERLLWDKSSALWNAHNVYPEVYFQATPERVVVVEGFKACMWVWQAGIKNVVALLGTYLSNQQRWILERMGAPVYMFFDNNDPGTTGIMKCGERLRRSLRLHVVEYPERLLDDEDAQPDSMTAEEIYQQINGARNYFDWLAH